MYFHSVVKCRKARAVIGWPPLSEEVGRRPNSEQKPEQCDATGDAQGTEAGKIKKEKYKYE
jgi:hypothetical protein